MNTNTDAMTAARDAMFDLYVAWERLAIAFDNQDAADVLNSDKNRDLYPFRESFRAMLGGVQEWAYNVCDDLDYEAGRLKVYEAMNSLYLKPSALSKIAKEIYDVWGGFDAPCIGDDEEE